MITAPSDRKIGKLSIGNILILYYSKDDSTRKKATYIAEGAAGISAIEVRVKSISEAKKEDILYSIKRLN